MIWPANRVLSACLCLWLARSYLFDSFLEQRRLTCWLPVKSTMLSLNSFLLIVHVTYFGSCCITSALSAAVLLEHSAGAATVLHCIGRVLLSCLFLAPVQVYIHPLIIIILLYPHTASESFSHLLLIIHPWNQGHYVMVLRLDCFCVFCPSYASGFQQLLLLILDFCPLCS